MFKVSTESYEGMLKIHYNTKTPFFIYGGPGIGKSSIPMQVFSKMVEERNELLPDAKKRKFVSWVDLNLENKLEAMEHPEKYFVYMDIRLAQYDSSDLRGIPGFANATEFLEYKPMSWALYFSKPEADGVLFFDEMNQAPPIVMAQAFQIVLDRTISDLRLSDNVFIMAAGNRASDKAQVFSMSFPLKDRFSEIELTLDDDGWCNHALSSGVDPRIVAFIKWKPSALYAPPTGSEDKGSTPRGIFRVDKLLKECPDFDSPLAYSLVASACGEAFSTEFQAFIKVSSTIDFETILTNPKKVKELTTADKKWALCGLLGEHAKKTADKDKDRMSCFFAVVHNMPTEYGVVALNIMRTSMSAGDTKSTKFRKALLAYPEHKDLIKHYAKFIDQSA